MKINRGCRTQATHKSKIHIDMDDKKVISIEVCIMKIRPT